MQRRDRLPPESDPPVMTRSKTLDRLLVLIARHWYLWLLLLVVIGPILFYDLHGRFDSYSHGDSDCEEIKSEKTLDPTWFKHDTRPENARTGWLIVSPARPLKRIFYLFIVFAPISIVLLWTFYLTDHSSDFDRFKYLGAEYSHDWSLFDSAMSVLIACVYLIPVTLLLAYPIMWVSYMLTYAYCGEEGYFSLPFCRFALLIIELVVLGITCLSVLANRALGLKAVSLACLEAIKGALCHGKPPGKNKRDYLDI